MSLDDIMEAFDPLWDDVRNESRYPAERPLLAHYTSISTLERIMSNDEVWFSNPLYMNDWEELRFAMTQGAIAFRGHAGLKAALTTKQYDLLLNTFDTLFEKFSNEHAFDIYVFCMTDHDEETTDGLLSMWRGYGGNGNGAAIIFDTAQFSFEDELDCLILSNVKYFSQEQRLNWINDKVSAFASLLAHNPVPDEMLYLPLHSFFERLKMFALFTKHQGFREEREWRVVYLKERDKNGIIADMLHYAYGRNGLEQKLKLRIKPIAGITKGDFSLKKIIKNVLLGPSVATPLSVMAVKRMLEHNGKPEIAGRIIASTTPFRTSL